MHMLVSYKRPQEWKAEDMDVKGVGWMLQFVIQVPSYMQNSSLFFYNNTINTMNLKNKWEEWQGEVLDTYQ